MTTNRRVVYIAQPASSWPVDGEEVRVFDNEEAARADCVRGRMYGKREVLSDTVCPHCGSLVPKA